jgi:hypothetical protein
MEHLTKMDDLGGTPYFGKPPYWNICDKLVGILGTSKIVFEKMLEH